MWAEKPDPARRQDAIVEIIATGRWRTHHLVKLLIYKVDVSYSRAKPPEAYMNIFRARFVPDNCITKLKVRRSWSTYRYTDSHVMPLPSISRSPARFLQASVIELNCSLRAQYLTSLQTTLQPYPWNAVILGLGMGNGYLSLKRNQKYHA